MPFRSNDETIDYRHPTWEEGSTWTFRRYMTGVDRDAVQNMTVDITSKFDPKAAREARRRREDYAPDISTERKQTAAIALILQMSVAWSGPEFTVPAELNGEKQPLAGQTAPLDAQWINARDFLELEDIENWLNDMYLGRSEDDQKSFRALPGGVDAPKLAKRSAVRSVS